MPHRILKQRKRSLQQNKRKRTADHGWQYASYKYFEKEKYVFL